MQHLAAMTSPYRLLVSPLLFESGQDSLVSRTLVVDVSHPRRGEFKGGVGVPGREPLKAIPKPEDGSVVAPRHSLCMAIPAIRHASANTVA